MASPPIIEEFICKWQEIPDRHYRTSYVLLRRQSNAFFMCRAPSLFILTNPIPAGSAAEMFGRFDDYYWYMDALVQTIRSGSRPEMVLREYHAVNNNPVDPVSDLGLFRKSGQ